MDPLTYHSVLPSLTSRNLVSPSAFLYTGRPSLHLPTSSLLHTVELLYNIAGQQYNDLYFPRLLPTLYTMGPSPLIVCDVGG